MMDEIDSMANFYEVRDSYRNRIGENYRKIDEFLDELSKSYKLKKTMIWNEGFLPKSMQDVNFAIGFYEKEIKSHLGAICYFEDKIDEMDGKIFKNEEDE